MQKQVKVEDFVEITQSARVTLAVHGWRAKCLQRLIRLDMPVPRTVALSSAAVRSIASGQQPASRAILAHFGPAPLVSVRPSPADTDWGGPSTVLNIGMNDERHAAPDRNPWVKPPQPRCTCASCKPMRSMSPGLIPRCSMRPKPAPETLRIALKAFEAEMDEPFPQDPERQLTEVLRSMARAWEGTTARILRQVKGAPADAGIGLIVQEMALGIGPGISGSGVIQFVDPVTGQPQITGRYLGQAQARAELSDGGALYLTRDPRGPSLEEICPDVFADLLRFGAASRAKLREEMQIEFTIEIEPAVMCSTR